MIIVLGSPIPYLMGRRRMMFQLSGFYYTVNPKKLETGLRPNNAGIPYTIHYSSGLRLLGFQLLGFYCRSM